MNNKKTEGKERLSRFLASWLRRQFKLWIEKGILNQIQKENIENLYIWPEQPIPPVPKMPTRTKEKPTIKLITVIQTIAAVLIGIGVISLIAYNWPKIPNAVKLLIIIVTIVSVHLTGFFILSYRPKYQKSGYAIIFLACLLYGGGIWLVAQIYHLHHHYPNGVLLWAIGVLPFAFALRSKLNYSLTVFLFILWTLLESIGFQKPHLTFLLILLGLLIPLSYYLKSKAGLAICIITGSLWLLINNIFWFNKDFSILLFLPLALYGVLLIAASNIHLLQDSFKHYRQIYLYIGMVIISFVLFLLPIIGIFQSKLRPLSLKDLPISFWICNAVLVIGSIFCKILTAKTQLDKIGEHASKMIPILLIASLYIIIMPSFEFSILLMVIPLILVAFTHWYFTKRTIIVDFFVIYIALWLPFLLFKWKQPFLLFLLFLLYGSFCYVLGWSYLSRLNAKKFGNFFRIFGLLNIFLSLYIFSFSSTAKYFIRDYYVPEDIEFWLIVALFYIIILSLYAKYVSSFNYPIYKTGLLPEEKILTPILPLIPIILFIVIANEIVNVYYSLIINFLFIGLLLCFLANGYRRRQKSLKIISFIFLLLLICTRYFELELSLLYKAILFIVTGIIVLVVGIFIEKRKDKVVSIDD